MAVGIVEIDAFGKDIEPNIYVLPRRKSEKLRSAAEFLHVRSSASILLYLFFFITPILDSVLRIP